MPCIENVMPIVHRIAAVDGRRARRAERAGLGGGWTSGRRARSGRALRRLPLAAEFAIKALAMTAVLTFVAVGLQFLLYPFPLSKRWVADEPPRILVIAFTASLLIGA